MSLDLQDHIVQTYHSKRLLHFNENNKIEKDAYNDFKVEIDKHFNEMHTYVDNFSSHSKNENLKSIIRALKLKLQNAKKETLCDMEKLIL